MKLFALKPCSFCGEKYFIGDEIPLENVLDPNAQASMGVLVVVDVESTDDGAAPEAGGPLLPPASTLENEEEDNNEESGESGETEESETVIYSKNKLVRMTKEELCAIAEQNGVSVTDEMTKDKIVDLIIESQGE